MPADREGPQGRRLPGGAAIPMLGQGHAGARRRAVRHPSGPVPLPDPVPRNQLLTLEEYLAFEDASDVRHEYVGGTVHAMTGVTRRHSRITMNIAGRLWQGARGGPCRVHHSEVKLRVGRVVYYPDVMVACGTPPRDPRLETAPCLVVEVLSDSTERIDRREKLLEYRTLASLGAYLIVDQERRLVEHHWRASDGWQHATLVDTGTIALPCPTLALTLDEIYEGVELPPLEEVLRVREAAAAYG